ncbi:DUF3592 domain-containing protein [Patescibacteria group bacterium]|nr:DUF3592 domain-containing protein [Patescibacteria group bacterium]MBP9710386.1 DUF3592 domain-containing protein [Patescibacteria group bacterium]
MFHPKGEFLWPVFIPTIILFLLVAVFVYRNVSFIRSSIRVKGTIIGYETVSQIRGPSTSAPLVQFTDEKGVTRELLAKVRSNPPPGQVGDKVTLYYQPNDPSQARLGTFKEMWLHVTILTVLFGIFFIIWFGLWAGDPNAQVRDKMKMTPQPNAEYDPDAEEFEGKNKK